MYGLVYSMLHSMMCENYIAGHREWCCGSAARLVLCRVWRKYSSGTVQHGSSVVGKSAQLRCSTVGSACRYSSRWLRERPWSAWKMMSGGSSVRASWRGVSKSCSSSELINETKRSGILWYHFTKCLFGFSQVREPQGRGRG